MIKKQNPHTFGKTAGATISNKHTRTGAYLCGVMTTTKIQNGAGIGVRIIYDRTPESTRNGKRFDA